INQILVETYWHIGKQIIEYEQKGKGRAEYGAKLLDNLSKDLKQKYGKGFSRSNLQYMRLLYYHYPKCQTLSGKLSWSHYVEFLSIEDDKERKFYEKQCLSERWSVRELSRQIDSALFHRIPLSNKKSIISKKDEQSNIIKDPYILEFLNIPEIHTEKELEQSLIDNLQMLLLELGKGFAFVARQKRITIGNNHFYVDLVFYNRILKCFVLIDLKIGKVSYQDIGQMNMYLNYFKKEETTENEPIGIVLGREKDDILVEYALGGLTNKLFVSKYKLYLPSKEEIKRALG
ncbi:PDDEXK nuclease domain-containing protein, partial [Desulfosarcina sp.]|nr:PDDEXK nuclease domain-containing protein [Desulfosarcina sp.]